MVFFQAFESHFLDVPDLIFSISCNNLSIADKNHSREWMSFSYFNQVFSTVKSDLVLAVDSEDSIVEVLRFSTQALVSSLVLNLSLLKLSIFFQLLYSSCLLSFLFQLVAILDNKYV